MVRKTVPEDKKRKKLAVSINPEVYELWKQYCSENGIENYSEYIEKIIIEKIKNKQTQLIETIEDNYVEYKGFNIEIWCTTTYGVRDKNGWLATIYEPGTKFPTLFIHHVLWSDTPPTDDDRSSYDKILEFAKKEIDLPNYRIGLRIKN